MTNINTSLTGKTEKPKFSIMMQSDAIQNLIKTTLRDKKRADRYIASIMSAVSANPSLQECDGSTVLSASLVAESLGLSHSPSMGQYFMVPYNDNKTGRKVATFQIGYKGLILLAMKSGQYKKLNVTSIKKGEFKGFNPITEEISINLIQDFDEREKEETVGYYAHFELMNGFTKAIYWTKAKMEKHATRYSQAYRNKYGSSFWLGDGFDDMAYKTLIKQLISKWGVMSSEFQQAFESDMAVIKEDGSKEYIDNDNSDLKDDKDEVQLKED